MLLVAQARLHLGQRGAAVDGMRAVRVTQPVQRYSLIDARLPGRALDLPLTARSVRWPPLRLAKTGSLAPASPEPYFPCHSANPDTFGEFMPRKRYLVGLGTRPPQFPAHLASLADELAVTGEEPFVFDPTAPPWRTLCEPAIADLSKVLLPEAIAYGA
jgi:hypothetical protein